MWIELIIGHLVGDYLLQTNWMAMNKTKNTLEGWLAATVHCLVYTFAIGLVMWEFNPMWLVLVFFSHFFIDKFSLGELYLKYIKGYGIGKFLNDDDSRNDLQDVRGTIIKGSFVTLVYTVTDNTMHFVLMYYGYLLIFN